MVGDPSDRLTGTPRTDQCGLESDRHRSGSAARRHVRRV